MHLLVLHRLGQLLANTAAHDVPRGLHLAQLVRSGRFQLFDYGSPAANAAHYGRAAPPDLGAEYWRLDMPVDIAAGAADGVIPTANTRRHYRQMREGGVAATYREFDYGHMDFTFATRDELRYWVMAKLMRKAKYGRIVNLTTIAVPMLIEGELSYAASKAALEKATEILAAELAPFGITCNLVGPSPVETDLIRGIPKAKMDALLNRLLTKRMATLDEVAYAVEVFADRRAGHLTAQSLYLGGVH